MRLKTTSKERQLLREALTFVKMDGDVIIDVRLEVGRLLGGEAVLIPELDISLHHRQSTFKALEVMKETQTSSRVLRIHFPGRWVPRCLSCALGQIIGVGMGGYLGSPKEVSVLSVKDWVAVDHGFQSFELPHFFLASIEQRS